MSAGLFAVSFIVVLKDGTHIPGSRMVSEVPNSWRETIALVRELVPHNASVVGMALVSGVSVTQYTPGEVEELFGISPTPAPVDPRRLRSVAVSTGDYRRSHMKEPRGSGSWAFCFGSDDETWFVPGVMPFAQAVKVAKEEAVRRGHTLVRAQP